MKITLYTTTTCAFCVMVKKYLDSKQQTYQAINLDEVPGATEEVVKLTGGQSVPVTVIDKENGSQPSVTVGWNPAALKTALTL